MHLSKYDTKIAWETNKDYKNICQTRIFFAPSPPEAALFSKASRLLNLLHVIMKLLICERIIKRKEQQWICNVTRLCLRVGLGMRRAQRSSFTVTGRSVSLLPAESGLLLTPDRSSEHESAKSRGCFFLVHWQIWIWLYK